MGLLRPNRPSDEVAGYLARGESVVMEMRQHWARVLPAIASCVGGLLLVLVAGLYAPAWMGPVTNLTWWLWLVLVAHLAFRIVEWRDETFVITNKRLVLVHGLLVKKVAMMPLSKVTDMSYNRSPVARVLGYGTFKIESAGQDQALNVIDFVRDPDEKYRDVCGLIFGLEDDDAPRHRRDARHDADQYDTDDEYDDVYDDPYGASDDFADPDPDDAAPYDAEDDDDAWAGDEGGSDEWDGGTDDRTAPLPQRPWRAGTRRVAPRGVPLHGQQLADSWDEDATDPHGLITTAVDERRDPPAAPARPYSESRSSTHEQAEFDPSESAWSVSREHATRPQPVRSSHHSAKSTEWRDEH